MWLHGHWAVPKWYPMRVLWNLMGLWPPNYNIIVVWNIYKLGLATGLHKASWFATGCIGGPTEYANYRNSWEIHSSSKETQLFEIIHSCSPWVGVSDTGSFSTLTILLLALSTLITTRGHWPWPRGFIKYFQKVAKHLRKSIKGKLYWQSMGACISIGLRMPYINVLHSASWPKPINMLD